MMKRPDIRLVSMTAAFAAFPHISGVLALDVVSDTYLNLRAGPGVTYPVIDTLRPGDPVTVGTCKADGWCRIEGDGPNGWVSSEFLRMTREDRAVSAPGCHLGLKPGAAGQQLDILCDGPTLVRPEDDDGTVAPEAAAPVGDEACFHTEIDYGGTTFCYATGPLHSLNPTFDDEISSVRLFGAAGARLCDENNLAGTCVDITENTPHLGPEINNLTTSLQVYSTATPVTATPMHPVNPHVRASGTVTFTLWQRVDLDDGSLGVSGADIRYHPIAAPFTRLEPVNGAMLARGDGSQRGYQGCSGETFSPTTLPFIALPSGTFVCYRTASGRIGQFVVTHLGEYELTIAYRTWAD